MRKIVLFIVFIALILMYLLGCTKSEIEPSAEPYVQNFLQECIKRGIRIHQTNIRVKFKRLENAQGHTNLVTKTIFIDPYSDGWRYNPEALVFHEMGHLVLHRDHCNEVVNKYVRSIMNSFDDPIYNTEELQDRREYYINELFDPQTPIPDFMIENE